jgi:hypothetical protein
VGGGCRKLEAVRAKGNQLPFMQGLAMVAKDFFLLLLLLFVFLLILLLMEQFRNMWLFTSNKCIQQTTIWIADG